MIKRILVGLGGTPFTTVATRIATELGDVQQAQLTGVTVVDTNKLDKLGPVLVGGQPTPSVCAKEKSRSARRGRNKPLPSSKRIAVSSR